MVSINTEIVSYKLALRLKELGFPQKGDFIYDDTYNPIWMRYIPFRKGIREEECVVAPTLSDLIRAMPNEIESLDNKVDDDNYFLTKSGRSWIYRGIYQQSQHFNGDSDVNNLAKLFIWCKEKKLI